MHVHRSHDLGKRFAFLKRCHLPDFFKTPLGCLTSFVASLFSYCTFEKAHKRVMYMYINTSKRWVVLWSYYLHQSKISNCAVFVCTVAGVKLKPVLPRFKSYTLS